MADYNRAINVNHSLAAIDNLVTHQTWVKITFMYETTNGVNIGLDTDLAPYRRRVII